MCADGYACMNSTETDVLIVSVVWKKLKVIPGVADLIHNTFGVTETAWNHKEREMTMHVAFCN